MKLSLLWIPAVLAACASNPPPAPPPPPAATATVAAPPPAPPPTPEPPPAPPAPPAPVAPTPAVEYQGVFSTPESVFYDAENDRYLVSNINGTPLQVDNNGYISVLSPDGQVIQPKWIEGGVKKVTLNAPKGMAVVGKILYVADISTVRMFDAKTGAPKGEVKLPGATFVNDLVASDGKVYASDSGLTPEFKSSGTDAVWVIEKNKAKVLAKSPELGGPNGLVVVDKSVWVVTFGTGEMYRLDEKGGKMDTQKLPTGGLDGIVQVGDQFLVSSWEGSQIFWGNPSVGFKPIFQALNAPADIGYDSKRQRVLVPRFMDNLVQVFDLPQ